MRICTYIFSKNLILTACNGPKPWLHFTMLFFYLKLKTCRNIFLYCYKKNMMTVCAYVWVSFTLLTTIKNHHRSTRLLPQRETWSIVPLRICEFYQCSLLLACHSTAFRLKLWLLKSKNLRLTVSQSQSSRERIKKSMRTPSWAYFFGKKK